MQDSARQPEPPREPRQEAGGIPAGRRRRAPRIEGQKRTVGIMIRAFCRLEHRGGGIPAGQAGELCADCAALLAYAQRKLDRCPFGEAKPFCSGCRVHCYGKAEREAIRRVMRKVGPRMLWLMPLRFVEHALRSAHPREPR